MPTDLTRLHTATFVWDDGQGESRCSPLYLETRNLLRVAAGKAAEARLHQDPALAESYEQKLRYLTATLERLRKDGHLGDGRRFDGSEFRAAFDNADPTKLRLL